MEGVLDSIRAAQLRSPFDRKAALVYAVVAFQIAATTLLLAWFGFSIRPEVWSLLSVWPILIVGGMASRRIGFDRVATGFETIGILHGQAFVCCLAIVAVPAFNAPYADAVLSAWDEALFFPWVAFVDAFRDWPRAMASAYISFNWQALILICLLSWRGMSERVWLFVTAAAISLTVCTIVFAFMPAKAPYAFYGVPELADYNAATRFIEPMERVRDGYRVISTSSSSGSITFPSYHAAALLLFCWAAWPTILRWPILALNVVMFAATIVIGGHYLVDLLAGFIVAIAALAFAKRVQSRSRSDPKSATSGLLPA